MGELNKRKRLFVGSCEIAGYYTNLVSGLRAQGYDVTFMGGNNHVFQYGHENHKGLMKIHDIASCYVNKTPRKKIFKKTFWLILEKITRLMLIVPSIRNHDVFIFGFGYSFFGTAHDLWILKKCRKKIISNLVHGSEIRPPYINGSIISRADFNLSLLKKRTRKTSKKIKTIEKYSDIILSAPLISHFLSKPYVSTSFIGVPVTVPDYVHKDVSPRKNNVNKPVTILHAPSNEAVKGSALIRQTIKKLKNQGYAINYQEIINKPHSDVIAALHDCDFIIDQLYSDGPMAGFATEAAWFCKPSIVGGYGWDILKKVTPQDQFPPTYLCHPDEIESAIETMLLDENLRHDLGKKAHNFVSNHWNQDIIAQKFSILIEDTPPENWCLNPDDTAYPHGVGISESKCRKIIQNLVKCYGIDSLCLKSSSAALSSIKSFAQITN